MRKLLFKSLACLLIAGTLSSCATVFGGPVSDYQRTKPAEGEPSRKVRAVALIADVILFWPGAIVDFATGAIYKPETARPETAKSEPVKSVNQK